MIIIKKNEVCKFSSNCPHNKLGGCFGTRSDRENDFVCNFVNEDGLFVEGHERSALDKTGESKVLYG